MNEFGVYHTGEKKQLSRFGHDFGIIRALLGAG